MEHWLLDCFRDMRLDVSPHKTSFWLMPELIRCVTCDFMLPQLVVLEGPLQWFDGGVVDVQQLLHGS